MVGGGWWGRSGRTEKFWEKVLWREACEWIGGCRHWKNDVEVDWTDGGEMDGRVGVGGRRGGGTAWS